MSVGKRKAVPSVLVDCRDCGDTFEVDQRTFDLAHEVSDGRFRCDDCFSIDAEGRTAGGRGE